MTRSHPPTLSTLAKRTLAEECGEIRGERILIAVSGGSDSQALLHVLARLAPRLKLELHAHGIDHGLRPEAGQELELAAALARSLEVPFSRSKIEVPPGGNLQARARTLRYEALAAAQEKVGATLLATAHHADDRAETVLLRLLRGSGSRGLAVLPARADGRIRPFIRAKKSDVMAHVERHDLRFASDPSNENRRYLRIRVRLELMPVMRALSPRIVDHLNALADELVEGAPPEVLDAHGEPVELGRAQLTQLRRLLETGSRDGRVQLAGGREVRLDPESGRPLLVEPLPAREPAEIRPLREVPEVEPFRKRRE